MRPLQPYSSQKLHRTASPRALEAVLQSSNAHACCHADIAQRQRQMSVGADIFFGRAYLPGASILAPREQSAVVMPLRFQQQRDQVILKRLCGYAVPSSLFIIPPEECAQARQKLAKPLSGLGSQLEARREDQVAR